MSTFDEDEPAGAPNWTPPNMRNMGSVRAPNWLTPQLLRNVAIALVAIVLLTSVAFQIKPEEVGLVLRFGKHVRTTEPGLHFKLPVVESVLRVPVQRQLKEEFGFRTAVAGARSGRRPHGHGSVDGRPPGNRDDLRATVAGARQSVRDGHRHRADRAAGRHAARSGQALVGRGQPGAAAARPADQ